MNHPKREEWIPYLYGESTPEARRELKGHLKVCPECRAELASWEQSLNRLDAWKLPRPRRHEVFAIAALKWTLAAAALLLLGFIAGLLSTAKPDMAHLRATLEPHLRQELRAELAQTIRDEVNKAADNIMARAQEQNATAIAASAANLEEKQRQDYKDFHAALLVLKEQLDTVAMNTDAGFRQAEQKLVRLADFKQPQKPSSQP